MKWIHHFGVDDFDAMTNVGKALREKLKASAEIRGPEIVSQDISADGTRKWVVRVASGSCVETVYIPQGKRGTLCVSSQASCALDCSFCSTGKQGFNSNLTAAEVIGQVWIANKSFGSVPATIDRAITNVVMMGMGEPLMNFDNVVRAMSVMRDDLGYGLANKRVTLSTVEQAAAGGVAVRSTLAVNARAAGPRLGRGGPYARPSPRLRPNPIPAGGMRSGRPRLPPPAVMPAEAATMAATAAHCSKVRVSPRNSRPDQAAWRAATRPRTPSRSSVR